VFALRFVNTSWLQSIFEIAQLEIPRGTLNSWICGYWQEEVFKFITRSFLIIVAAAFVPDSPEAIVYLSMWFFNQ